MVPVKVEGDCCETCSGPPKTTTTITTTIIPLTTTGKTPPTGTTATVATTTAKGERLFGSSIHCHNIVSSISVDVNFVIENIFVIRSCVFIEGSAHKLTQKNSRAIKYQWYYWSYDRSMEVVEQPLLLDYSTERMNDMDSPMLPLQSASTRRASKLARSNPMIWAVTPLVIRRRMPLTEVLG